MLKTRPKCNFQDERGEITDIFSNEPVEHVTLITSKKGAVRANHYHKETVQFNYVVSGRIQLLTQNPGEKVQSTILMSGDLAVTPAGESHALIALEDSTFMVFTRGPRGGMDYENDTFRLATPLKVEV
jgi:quercetin dioxygenase-like cupin family protein